MKLISIRSVLGMAVVALVSACGGQVATDAPTRTAAVMQVVMAPAQGVTTNVQAASTQAPTPDCAAQHCQGLRIIDGNAEAYRVDAQRRAANGGGPQA